MKWKLAPKRILPSRKKAASSYGSGGEKHNLTALERHARRDIGRFNAAIKAGQSFRSGFRGCRQASP